MRAFTTTGKLWVGFGVLATLGVLFSATMLARLNSIEALVAVQADVARVRSDTARQLEIHVLSYGLGVRDVLRHGDAQARRAVAEEAAGVDRETANYLRLAGDDRRRALAARFTALWQQARTHAEQMLDAAERDRAAASSPDLLPFRAMLGALETFLDDELQTEAVAAYTRSVAMTSREVRASIDLTLALLVAGALTAAITGVVVGRGIVRTEAELAESLAQREASIVERTAELAGVAESLRRSNLELEQFASVAAHDLQEPLRKIQAFGDRLLTKNRADLGEQGREYLDRMLASAARMRRLIDDLLAFSRVASKAQPFVATDLNVVAAEVVSDLEARIERSGGAVDVGELTVLDADALQMRQLLQNLIGNALKFQRPGVRPHVRVCSRTLVIEAGQNGAAATAALCEITVADNGIGFDETYLDRIFELFQRLHGRDEYEGTGMGLAICRKIAERHHGQITASSTPGGGATFIVTLPLRQNQPDSTQ